MCPIDFAIESALSFLFLFFKNEISQKHFRVSPNQSYLSLYLSNKQPSLLILVYMLRNAYFLITITINHHRHRPFSSSFCENIDGFSNWSNGYIGLMWVLWLGRIMNNIHAQPASFFYLFKSRLNNHDSFVPFVVIFICDLEDNFVQFNQSLFNWMATRMLTRS